MLRVLLVFISLSTYATSALAVGADLDFSACPGGTGSAIQANLDCASGGTLDIYATFQPNEAIADLVAIDALIDLRVESGDAHSSADFWDFEGTNSGAIAISRLRPATVCNVYTNAWTPAGSGEGVAALVRSPSQVRIAASAYRPTNLAVGVNQKVFGFVLTVDLATALEAGGTANGCATPITMTLIQLMPGSASGAPVTLLTGPSVNVAQCVFINRPVYECGGLPAARHTWGQLKSLYR